MITAAKSFPTLSQPVLVSEVWGVWAAKFEKENGLLDGAGYRVRTDDIQLGNITLDHVNPEGNDSKPFPQGAKRPPSPSGKGFATGGPKGDDARWFGGAR